MGAYFYHIYNNFGMAYFIINFNGNKGPSVFFYSSVNLTLIIFIKKLEILNYPYIKKK